jgi:hypothetical protein
MGNDGHLWTKGESSNPNGRPKGSRNKRTQEILDLIQERGDKDPLDALSKIISTKKDPAIVAQASNMLARRVHRELVFPATTVIPSFPSRRGFLSSDRRWNGNSKCYWRTDVIGLISFSEMT